MMRTAEVDTYREHRRSHVPILASSRHAVTRATASTRATSKGHRRCSLIRNNHSGRQACAREREMPMLSGDQVRGRDDAAAVQEMDARRRLKIADDIERVWPRFFHL